jgi:hypothetical protein
MTGYNTTQNQKIVIISALVLVVLAFCGRRLVVRWWCVQCERDADVSLSVAVRQMWGARVG